MAIEKMIREGRKEKEVSSEGNRTFIFFQQWILKMGHRHFLFVLHSTQLRATAGAS